MQEVAQALWSLAKLRQTRPKLLARLAAQASEIVGELNGRDVSTIVWAFGSMRSKMDPELQQGLSAAAVRTWGSMQPQVKLHSALCLMPESRCRTSAYDCRVITSRCSSLFFPVWQGQLRRAVPCSTGGLAKLDAKPEEDLLDLALASLHTKHQEYGHQALVHYLYCHALGMIIVQEF